MSTPFEASQWERISSQLLQVLQLNSTATLVVNASQGFRVVHCLIDFSGMMETKTSGGMVRPRRQTCLE